MHVSYYSLAKIRLGLIILIGIGLSACSTNAAPTDTDTIHVDTETIQRDILYSTDNKRANARPVDGARVTGTVYLHLADTNNVSQVRYYLDNTTRSASPFKTATPGETVAINTKDLSDGTHMITVAPSYKDGSTKVYSSAMLVDNSGAHSDKLLLSKNADRGYSRFLDGKTIPAKSYVFVVPKEPVERIDFYLDDPERRNAPRQVERYAFHDVGGTAQNGLAWPINRKTLGQGAHTLTAVIRRKSGQVITTQARFTVSDSAAAPSPEPEPEPTPAPAPTPSYGPVQNPNIPGGATYISPGQSIGSVIKSKPSGSTFVLKAGVHRGQSFVLSRNSTLIGEYGAVLSGAKVVSSSSYSYSNGYWVLSNQTQEAKIYDGVPNARRCLDGYPACRRSEQVFLNGKSLKQVTSLGAVGAGQFFFDYGANKIYLRDDPRGKKLEVSHTQRAIVAEEGATVRNLVIEKYNTSSLYPTVYGARGTTFERNTIRLNSGAGLSFTDNVVIRNNAVNRNTRIGLLGYKAHNALIEKNEIAHNNSSGHYYDHEAGGLKMIESRDVRVRGNYSHHNLGAGLWSDIENSNILYENNVVTDNLGNGIFHELGYATEIRYNVVERNRRGISVNNSANVKVHHNTLRDNATGLYASNLCRSEAVEQKARNTTFYNNTVYQKGHVGPGSEWYLGKAAAFYVARDCQYWSTPYNDFFDKMGNRWYGNTYHLTQTSSMRNLFFWKHQELTYDQWKAKNQN